MADPADPIKSRKGETSTTAESASTPGFDDGAETPNGAMPETLQGEVTLLLRRMGTGDGEAMVDLVPLIYDELRRMARSHMRRERDGHTLQPTALVNEVYLRLAQQHQANWQNRGHFFCIAARMMRRILVDSSRARRRGKRGGGEPMADVAEIDVAAPTPFANTIDVLALHEAMERLAVVDSRMVQVVELRFFAGLSNSDIAEALGISEPTVKRSWVTARAWLFHHMQTHATRGDG